ncbi:uncharacterized protein F5147DRAFT_839898 [Suillus discolor]|uniref:DUF6533 domain-containing protein n=1 Tax=Suillus discolor TaxID=1912936 RepID=A0A9P7EZF6_9AGAM|nr:uncharacterized protein F5147DRAFT_839898 [Suillus discolor]KAG2097054.1 hypothetical protein F5147DRAFT_839898 [Suillus discolor]
MHMVADTQTNHYKSDGQQYFYTHFLRPNPMTIVSDDPTWWSFISYSSLINYFVAASSTVVIYDRVLTFGQEFELILRQHWSLMTILYICVRYIGILFSVINILSILPVSIIDVVGTMIWYIGIWTPVIVNTMLGVTMIARINAMYQGSKRLFILLVVALLACTIASVVMVVIANLGVSAQEAVLSGYDICIDYNYVANLNFESLVSTAAWEILALFLTVWMVIKHIRELRQLPTGLTIGDCFTMLIKSHTFYFLAFAIMVSLRLGALSQTLTDSSSVGSDVYFGIWSIAEVLQMFVLGPRLILSMRDYHAKLVARADGEIDMTSFSTFQAGGDVLTDGYV